MKKFNVVCFALMGILGFSQAKYNAIHTDLMDKNVRPQDDFYNFVNGNWMKNTEIPSDRARWGSFDELRENTDAVSLGILKNLLGKTHPQGSDEQKIGDLYESFVDFDNRDKAGLKPIQLYLDTL